jgi:hypothetical protein
MLRLPTFLAALCVLECTLNSTALLPVGRQRRRCTRIALRASNDDSCVAPSRPDVARRAFLATVPLAALVVVGPSSAFAAAAVAGATPAVATGATGTNPLVWSPLGSGRTLTTNSQITSTREPSRFKVRFITYLTR